MRKWSKQEKERERGRGVVGSFNVLHLSLVELLKWTDERVKRRLP